MREERETVIRQRHRETVTEKHMHIHTQKEREAESQTETHTHTHRERCLEKRTTLITVQAGNGHIGVHYMFKNVHNKKSKKK